MQCCKHLLFILPMTLSLICCRKSFLDVPTKSNITREEYVEDLATTSDYLNGVYVILSRDFYQGYNQIYPDLIADNIKPVTANLTPHYNWSQDPGSSVDMSNYWRNGYLTIRSCNFVLEKATEYRDQNEAKADDMIAQAYALRAFTHFQMVNVFAQPYFYSSDASHPGIPYVTTHDWTRSVSRQSVAEVYSNIINDLTIALPLFNAGKVNVTLMNRNAVKALLARVFLFKGDFGMAKNWARDIGAIIPLMTNSNYPSKLFTNQETEAIFQLLPSTGSTTGSYATDFQGRYFFAGASTQFLATRDITDLLLSSTADTRKNWVKKVTVAGVPKDTIVKYPVNANSTFNPKSGDYYPTIIRSSEMYLTAAEAYAKLNNEDSARFYVNAIRTRANVSSLTSSITGAALLDSIYTERRKELAFEGFRMFDLLRWKKGVNRIDAINPAYKVLSYPSTNAIAPIPRLDVSVSGLLQNDGY
jgi:hypothetical protein